ncbi:divisome protein SepX/GlpR [Pilimelia columellifera]|uniref:Uncharacterized protein n=1 Tax=Pilimelia columellifera subsp. columellifera TaxID=706583 RepID=A0ABN3NFZ6_9ACTN
MPTSVLLAVLAAAGLLALAPALVRRYDATERLVAERTSSTARVLDRTRRPRTVPGRRPINPPRHGGVTPTAVDPPNGAARPWWRRSDRAGRAPAVYRRRRVLAALILLNLVELAGVALIGPGFWVGVVVTGTLLLIYLGHLRSRALRARRARRARVREQAWLAARQAEVRQRQAARAAARRQMQRRLAAEREALRRNALDADAAELPAAAGGGSVSYRRLNGVRGRAYEAGRPGSRPA